MYWCERTSGGDEGVILYVPVTDWHYPFVVLYSVAELFIAIVRDDRIWADYVNKSVGTINAGLNLLQPLRSGHDIVIVDPGLFVTFFERVVESTYEILIPARVGDKNVRHVTLLRGTIRTSK
jgi:hypothetical protein